MRHVASNEAYVASLTDEQSVAYDRALIGEVPVGSDPTDTSFVPAGCWGEAYHDMLVRFASLDAFSDELGSLNSRLTSDPRVTRLDAAWSACMKAAGFDHANRAELIASVHERLVGLELVGAEGDVAFGPQSALDQVLVDERAAAVASFDCLRPLADELTRLRYDYEREFLGDNRFRIETLVDDS